MKFRVDLLRAVEQIGVIEVDAATPEDAERLAMELAKSRGKLTRQPTWQARVDVRNIAVIGVEAL